MSGAERPKVVIVGAGFGGIAAAQRLVKSRAHCDITLVSKSDTFEYYPALYKLVTGALAIEVSVPLRRLRGIRGVNIVRGTFTGVDSARKVIKLEGGTEHAYDYLVLALGSETNYFGIEGLPNLSYSFKSVKEAFRLKRHFCDLFSSVKGLSNKEAVAKLHTVIVGGGPSGVELAGDLTHYLRGLARSMDIDPSVVTIDLIESNPRLLSVMPPRVSAAAERHLRMLGVNVYLNRAVTRQDIEGVSMGNMDFQSTTVIWTAGTRINNAYTAIPGVTMSERKRVVVNEYLALPTDDRISVIGDGAATPFSGLAQTAIHDGSYIGRQIAARIRGERGTPYEPQTASFVIPVGNYWALFVFRGKRLFKGLLPWLLRSAVDFRYFLSIVPLWYVLDVFRQGHKYRKSRTYCPIE